MPEITTSYGACEITLGPPEPTEESNEVPEGDEEATPARPQPTLRVCKRLEMLCIIPMAVCFVALGLCITGLKWAFSERVPSPQPPYPDFYPDPNWVGQEQTVLPRPPTLHTNRTPGLHPKASQPTTPTVTRNINMSMARPVMPRDNRTDGRLQHPHSQRPGNSNSNNNPRVVSIHRPTYFPNRTPISGVNHTPPPRHRTHPPPIVKPPKPPSPDLAAPQPPGVTLSVPTSPLASPAPLDQGSPPPLSTTNGGLITIEATTEWRGVEDEWSGHSRVCNDSERAYCVNGGRCYVIEAAGMYQLSCQCKEGYYGQRCMETEPRTDTVINGKRHLGLEFAEAEELYQKRVLTITGICIALLVVGIMCVVAYCKTKKQRQRLHNHLRHGMHAMNVNPPNGPHNQPQPPPSPAPAPDNSIQLRNIGASPSQYVQKNPGSDEHQLSRDTDCSFSTSHHSTTPTTSSRHNCRQCWGSGQSDESASMETNSGPLTTTGSSSRETSRPAAQCPAPRGHISAVSGPPDGRIRCDSHDLPDSPLSDRYVSAVTTPSRSSPVDILFPRHNGLLIDIPPGLRSPRPMSGSPKLWRQRGRPDLIRGGSSSSIPPSPAQFLEEEEYETTQEYEFSAPMSAPLPPTSSAPSSTNMGKGRAMRRNGKRRNGGAGIMGLGPSSTNVIMSSSTELSIGSSGGESEGESDFEIGENTPFLGIPLSLTSAGHSSFTPVGDGITFPGSAISGHSLAGPCVLPARLAYPLARATTGNGRQDSVSSVITTSQFSSEEELRMAGCTRALRDRDPIAV